MTTKAYSNVFLKDFNTILQIHEFEWTAEMIRYQIFLLIHFNVLGLKNYRMIRKL